MDTVALIIPAAGSGSRLLNTVPKPYINIKGKSILEHTIRSFLALEELREIVIATSKEYIGVAENLLEQVPNDLEKRCVLGGETRQHSIMNALKTVTDTDLVAVHDAVRPFVRKAVIQSCCKAASKVGAALVGVPAKDTIKKVDQRNIISETPERKYLWQAQTPQVFRTELLRRAYEKAEHDNFIGTDDASLVERIGAEVKIVEGDRMNFKITYPVDLTLAKILIEEQETQPDE